MVMDYLSKRKNVYMWLFLGVNFLLYFNPLTANSGPPLPQASSNGDLPVNNSGLLPGSGIKAMTIRGQEVEEEEEEGEGGVGIWQDRCVCCVVCM